MRTVITLALLLALAPAARAEEAKAEAKPAKADLGVTLYAVGQVVNQQLEAFDLTPAEFEAVLKGLTESRAGKPKQVLDTAMQQDINKLASERHGGPASFPLNGVIPSWTEGVQKMKVGGKSRLVCPAAIAYGDRGAGSAIPPGATLDFEVELIEIVK